MVYEHHRSKISVNILSEIMFMVTILKKKNNADNTSTVNSKSEKMCITVSHIYNTVQAVRIHPHKLFSWTEWKSFRVWSPSSFKITWFIKVDASIRFFLWAYETLWPSRFVIKTVCEHRFYTLISQYLYCFFLCRCQCWWAWGTCRRLWREPQL